MTKPFPETKLRKVSTKDLPSIWRLFTDSISEVCKNDYNEEQLDAWTSAVNNREKWIHRVSRLYFLAAEIDGLMVGFGALDRDYLDLLFVHKDFLGRGVANALYKALEEESLRLGCKRIETDASITARPFFEKKGFVAVRENRHVINGITLTNYRMSREMLVKRRMD